MMNTCVSLSCPFISYCRFYNFLVDRGERCAIQQEISYRAERKGKSVTETEWIKLKLNFQKSPLQNGSVVAERHLLPVLLLMIATHQ